MEEKESLLKVHDDDDDDRKMSSVNAINSTFG